ncbi:MAG: tetratricopeptide repeat protein [Acidobacteriota bacterium]
MSFTESLAIKETPEAHLERGNAYKNLRQGGKAVADWNQAIQLDANDTAAYTARGTFYQASGDTAKALADLEQSLRLTPTVDGFFQRGQLYATLGQYDKALRDYDQAIAERRDAPYVYLARSAAKKALGDEEGSQRDAARAAELQHSK